MVKYYLGTYLCGIFLLSPAELILGQVKSARPTWPHCLSAISRSPCGDDHTLLVIFKCQVQNELLVLLNWSAQFDEKCIGSNLMSCLVDIICMF